MKKENIAKKKVGVIPIVGRPGTGKSTLINSIIGEKVAITSWVPQTTRNRIKAIYQDKESQIIFIDTPGYHKSDKKFNKLLIKEVDYGLKNADAITYVIDGSRAYGEEEETIVQKLTKEKKHIYVLINKSDRLKDPEKTVKGLEKHLKPLKNKSVHLISAKEHIGLQEWIEEMKESLEESIPLYSEDYYTDQPVDFRITEIVREKVFLHTKEELPHACYTELTEYEEKPEKNLLVIYVSIFVERESQKGIIIGEKGSMVNKIGREAKIDLENIFEKKIYLDLKVKVKKKWRKDEKLLKKLLTI